MRGIVCVSSTKFPIGGNSRRSASYKPSSWNYKSLPFFQARHDQVHKTCHQELRNYVKQLICIHKDSQLPLRLNLVHTLHRLGVAYHFQTDIEQVLESISIEEAKRVFSNDIGFMTLLFRLLRERGLLVSQEFFSHFIDKKNLKTRMQNDIKELLHLYEASYLALEKEELLDDTRAFSSKSLVDLMPCMDQTLKTQVEHALEIPFHWRVSRLEARWFIDHQTGDGSIDPLLLKFAKLDFNHVQILHQAELTELSRW
ncbi:hypothetical protein LUZ60_005482 [Juncus effusus]|nr:hypothetical protein LUZ60_005482 [Juncus effusus]